MFGEKWLLPELKVLLLLLCSAVDGLIPLSDNTCYLAPVSSSPLEMACGIEVCLEENVVRPVIVMPHSWVSECSHTDTF